MPPLGNKIKKILKSATYRVTDLRNTAGKYQSKTQIYQVKGYRCACEATQTGSQRFAKKCKKQHL